MNPLGKCEKRGCEDDAVGFDDDGRALCADCLFEQSCEGMAGHKDSEDDPL